MIWIVTAFQVDISYINFKETSLCVEYTGSEGMVKEEKFNVHLSDV